MLQRISWHDSGDEVVLSLEANEDDDEFIFLDMPKKAPNKEPPSGEEKYREASQFITSFLANPGAAKQDAACRLTVLQSLIVELGLATSGLPTSLRSAQAFLKARAFINIREYLDHRSKDQAALKTLLYPSRKALIKDIRRKRNTVSRNWVKEHGLGVLLVHHR